MFKVEFVLMWPICLEIVFVHFKLLYTLGEMTSTLGYEYPHPLQNILVIYLITGGPLHLFKKKASEYNKEQRKFDITLHLRGPKAYRYLRSMLQLPLPHPRS